MLIEISFLTAIETFLIPSYKCQNSTIFLICMLIKLVWVLADLRTLVLNWSFIRFDKERLINFQIIFKIRSKILSLINLNQILIKFVAKPIFLNRPVEKFFNFDFSLINKTFIFKNLKCFFKKYKLIAHTKIQETY